RLLARGERRHQHARAPVGVRGCGRSCPSPRRHDGGSGVAELPETGRRSRLSGRPAQQPDDAGELRPNQTVSAIIANKDYPTMSDDFSGPGGLSEPAADITDVYAFPAPDSPDHLVLVLDVFGKSGPSAVFSDAVIYRFRIRPVEIAATGPK